MVAFLNRSKLYHRISLSSCQEWNDICWLISFENWSALQIVNNNRHLNTPFGDKYNEDSKCSWPSKMLEFDPLHSFLMHSFRKDLYSKYSRPVWCESYFRRNLKLNVRYIKFHTRKKGNVLNIFHSYCPRCCDKRLQMLNKLQKFDVT